MDIAISSIALVVLILMSYSFAWSHMPAYMVASIVGAISAKRPPWRSVQG